MNDEVKAIVAAGYAEHVRDIAMSRLLQEEEIENLRHHLEPKAIMYGDKIKTSPTDSTIPDGIIKLQEMIKEYMDTVTYYVDLINEMHQALRNIDVVCRTALTKHYIFLMTWEEVCIDMGYSYSSIMKVRRRGLIGLYDYMPEEYRRVLPKAIEDRDIYWPSERDYEDEEPMVIINGEQLNAGEDEDE